METAAAKRSLQHKFKILVVDDDAVIRMIHKKRLQDSKIPHPIITCKHGKEAVQHLEADPLGETAFLVLLDLNMPVMNGWEFLEACQKRAEHRPLFVVVISSSINEADHLQAMKYPHVIQFCEKPFNGNSLKKITSLKELAGFL